LLRTAPPPEFSAVESFYAKKKSKKLNRLKKLYELSMTVSGDPVEVFCHIAKIIGEIFELKVVYLSKINGDRLNFLAVYLDGQIVTDAGSCNLAFTPCATVEETQDVRILIQDTEVHTSNTFTTKRTGRQTFYR